MYTQILTSVLIIDILKCNIYRVTDVHTFNIVSIVCLVTKLKFNPLKYRFINKVVILIKRGIYVK
jgi:hypothetical protein